MVSINPSLNSVRPLAGNTKLAARVNFSANSDNIKKDETDPKNPISKLGEYSLGIQKSFYNSLKTAGRAFAETAYYGSGSTDDFGSYLVLCSIAGVLFGIGTFVIQFPKNLYDANVNFFAKKEQANSDLASFATEKVLFDQIGEKGKTASEEEKARLAKDFLKVKKSETALRDYNNFSPFKNN